MNLIQSPPPHPEAARAQAGGTREQMPRYRWIREQLVKMIIDGRLKGGDPLPPEGQLARHFGVALGTLRKAIDDLVARNVMERVQGKGLFITTYDRQAAMRLFRIVNEDGTKELPQFGELLGVRTRAPTANECRRLLLQEGEAVVELRRTRVFSDGARMTESMCLQASRFPGLEQRLGELRPILLYDFYEQEYGVRIVSVVSRIRAVAADRDDARLIGVREGAPLLEIERVAQELGTHPVELRVSRCDTASGRHYLDNAV